jgi:hypothetical protein
MFVLVKAVSAAQVLDASRNVLRRVGWTTAPFAQLTTCLDGCRDQIQLCLAESEGMKPHLPQLLFDLSSLCLRRAMQVSFTLQVTAQCIQQIPPTHPAVDPHVAKDAGMALPEVVPDSFIRIHRGGSAERLHELVFDAVTHHQLQMQGGAGHAHEQHVSMNGRPIFFVDFGEHDSGC